MINKTSLLLETAEGRKIATSKRNYKELKSFINAFGLKVSLVKIQEGKIYNLKNVCEIFVDHYSSPKYKYEVVKEKYEND